ncbi:MAG: hypothetical protein AAF569_00260 [Pseudomonadota bacterium]
MNKPVLIVLAVAVGLATLIGALVWTFGLKPIQDNESTSPRIAEENAQPLAPLVNQNIYSTGTPVMGTIENRLNITPQYNEDGVFAIVDSAHVLNLKHSPEILFYKPNGLAYVSTGQIKAKASAPEQTDKTRLNIAVSDQILDEKPEKAAMILSKNPLAKRLPLSALVKDPKTDEALIWTLNPNIEKPTQGMVNKQSIRIKNKDDDFFDVGRRIRITQLVILNPDSELESGQTVQFRIAPFDAPMSSDKQKALYQEANEGKLCEPRSQDASACAPDGSCEACAPATNSSQATP